MPALPGGSGMPTKFSSMAFGSKIGKNFAKTAVAARAIRKTSEATAILFRRKRFQRPGGRTYASGSGAVRGCGGRFAARISVIAHARVEQRVADIC